MDEIQEIGEDDSLQTSINEQYANSPKTETVAEKLQKTKIDDLRKVGVIKSSGVVNFTNAISLPSTKRNKKILTGGDSKSLKVIKGSQQIATTRK